MGKIILFGKNEKEDKDAAKKRLQKIIRILLIILVCVGIAFAGYIIWTNVVLLK